MHSQDVRVRGSPPLSHYLEYAQTVISKPAPAHPPKPVLDVMLHERGSLPPYTYDLKYNTSMYTFVTYYFPMKAQLVANRPHMHSQQGDELWIVRGRQRDLGLRGEVHRPVVSDTAHLSAHDPLTVPDGLSLDAFMEHTEQHIRNVSKAFRSKISSEAVAATVQRRMRGKLLEFAKEYETDFFPMYPPEILCRYYGQAIRVTKNDLRLKAQDFERRYATKLGLHGTGSERSEGMGAIQQAAASLFGVGGGRRQYRVYGSKWHAEDDRSVPQHRLVSAKEQVRNAYEGALPGYYYRSQSSSQERGQGGYPPACNNFDVQPGDFITVIHFIRPRVFEGDAHEVFNDTMLSLDQHTRLYAQVHVPDFDIM